MKTGFRDSDGKIIYEGDYVETLNPSPVKRTYPQLSVIGRVAWNSLSDSWQILRLILPSPNTNPAFWGKTDAICLDEQSAKKFELLRDARDFKFKKRNGVWKPESFYSGGVVVNFSTYADAHKEVQHEN